MYLKGKFVIARFSLVTVLFLSVKLTFQHGDDVGCFGGIYLFAHIGFVLMYAVNTLHPYRGYLFGSESGNQQASTVVFLFR